MQATKKADLRRRFPFIDDGCKFNIGDGWFQIIAGFCGAARLHSDDTFRITQLEFRDGKLNIEYVGRGGSYLDKLVAWAEIRSMHACEQCSKEFKADYQKGTRICQVGNRKARLCPDCWGWYELLPDSSREAVFAL